MSKVSTIGNFLRLGLAITFKTTIMLIVMALFASLIIASGHIAYMIALTVMSGTLVGFVDWALAYSVFVLMLVSCLLLGVGMVFTFAQYCYTIYE